ncbi:MAG: hypothetical protein ACO29X_03275 [Arcobacteraceae bacterium]
MYMVSIIFILLLLSIFGALLYYKSKNQRQRMLEKNECPDCGAKKKTFKDMANGVTFESLPIKERVLKSHGCTGVYEIEYSCTSCNLKEIHNSLSRGCGV